MVSEIGGCSTFHYNRTSNMHRVIAKRLASRLPVRRLWGFAKAGGTGISK